MTIPRRYPKIGIRSKNELAKRISDDKFTQQEALALINDVIKNKDTYWKDSKRSEPEA
jgi:non-homologous end joining protein Ku